ncbi:sensor histidine kinase [Kineosporia succinea]|uniref:histidine kinase n=1 Tax=Kineosporia succinea TaxID=84632 RepID=A0ABT9NZM6_9ACTN|nr:histidine kinase [Kineosporia succinea]MDP9825883.1 signal transduction histidine kinase [Kineosporia succinea]
MSLESPAMSGWLPGEMNRMTDAGGHRPRSGRDWAVDTLLFLLAGLMVVLLMVTAEPDRPPHPVLQGLDVALGVPCILLLWWRRRWPVRLAFLMAPLTAVSAIAGLPALALYFTVIVHRPLRHLLPLGLLNLAAGCLSLYVRPDLNGSSALGNLFINVLLISAVTAWALFTRARRQLVVSLRDRAERAESERNLLLEQARASERTRIAREMHDVLGHRISLITMHAGALEFRADKAGPEVAESAAVIRASAHQALQELREVIGVLRTHGDEDIPDRPQPTLGDIPDLVEESRRAGMNVSLELGAQAGGLIGRTVYRIVQEGLTNARKHAPHTAVRVTVTGAPGTGIDVTVVNRAPLAPPDEMPGAGQGLVGLAERVNLGQGRLEHGRTTTGDFRLRAWLPWPVDEDEAGARDV